MPSRDDSRIVAREFREVPEGMRKFEMDGTQPDMFVRLAKWVLRNRLWDDVLIENSYAVGCDLHTVWLMWPERTWHHKLDKARWRVFTLYIKDDDDIRANLLLSIA